MLCKVTVILCILRVQVLQSAKNYDSSQYSSTSSFDQQDSYLHVEMKKISIVRNGTQYIKRTTVLLIDDDVQRKPNNGPSYCDPSGACYYDETLKKSDQGPYLDRPKFDWYMSSRNRECGEMNSSGRKRNSVQSYGSYSIATILGLLLIHQNYA